MPTKPELSDLRAAETLLRECILGCTCDPPSEELYLHCPKCFDVDWERERALIARLLAEKRVARELLQGLGLTYLDGNPPGLALHVGRHGGNACTAQLHPAAYIDNEDIRRAIEKVDAHLAATEEQGNG